MNKTTDNISRPERNAIAHERDYYKEQYHAACNQRDAAVAACKAAAIKLEADIAGSDTSSKYSANFRLQQQLMAATQRDAAVAALRAMVAAANRADVTMRDQETYAALPAARAAIAAVERGN